MGRCSKYVARIPLLFLTWLLNAGLRANAEESVQMYFGLGCFWHVQYKFIRMEEKFLGRAGSELTAITGYAASNAGGQFCYTDGKLHAEVVQVVIPISAVPSFTADYWKMFVGKDRSHTGDIGPNYRAVIGLPGGMNSPLLPEITAAQAGNVAQTFELRAGVGDDADTLGSALVWVYDSNQFPFQQAEIYHQFHDDYKPDGKYPESYNQLTNDLQSSGRLKPTGCPNDPAIDANSVRIYFGLGCFWHVQYKFIRMEEKFLGRAGSQLTAITGYAASNAGGQFCYKDDKLHAEAVEVVIPISALPNFTASYWSMFVGKDRSHTGDTGPNYRAVIGLPGGMNSPLIPEITAAQAGNVAQTFELRAGVGDDADTLGSALVWVYDSNQFPFQQAEIYHQFHDDYKPDGKYPDSYNQLTLDLQLSGRLKPTGCPNDASSGSAPFTTHHPLMFLVLMALEWCLR